MCDIEVSLGGRERLSQAVDILVPEFEDDPVINWLLHDVPSSRRDAYFRSFFNSLLTAAALNSATFFEAGDWSSCLVLMNPGDKVDNPWTWFAAGLPSALWNVGISGCRRILFQFPGATDGAKARAMQGETKFFYVFFVATRTDSRKKGLCSALIKQCQAEAEAKNCPLWLEATTAYSRDVYLKSGFRVTEELLLGKNEVDAQGRTKARGEGVPIWGMIWTPTAGVSTS